MLASRHSYCVSSRFSLDFQFTRFHHHKYEENEQNDPLQSPLPPSGSLCKFALAPTALRGGRLVTQLKSAACRSARGWHSQAPERVFFHPPGREMLSKLSRVAPSPVHGHPQTRGLCEGQVTSATPGRAPQLQGLGAILTFFFFFKFQ